MAVDKLKAFLVVVHLPRASPKCYVLTCDKAIPKSQDIILSGLYIHTYKEKQS
jgi:hypothetical protein